MVRVIFRGARNIGRHAKVCAIALGATSLFLATTAQAQARLANGVEWTRSSPTEKRAYLAGISNTVSAGAAWDAKNLPPGQKSFMSQAQRALDGSSVDDAISAIDGWYKANPTSLDKPVLSVIWLQIAKPRLAQGQ